MNELAHIDRDKPIAVAPGVGIREVNMGRV